MACNKCNPCTDLGCKNIVYPECIITKIAYPCIGTTAGKTGADVFAAIDSALCSLGNNTCTPVIADPGKTTSTPVTNPDGVCSGYKVGIAPVLITQINNNTTNITNVTNTVNNIVNELNGLTTIKVSVSSAQILNSFTVPVVLIPAPGSGKVLQIVSFIIYSTFVTTPYTIASAVNLKYDASGSAVTYDIATALATSANRYISGSANGVSSSTITNKAILLESDVSDPTLGDGTLTFYITYQTITI